jgi:hypothetical protein
LAQEIQQQYTKLYDHFYKTIFKLLAKMIDRKVDWKEHIAEVELRGEVEAEYYFYSDFFLLSLVDSSRGLTLTLQSSHKPVFEHLVATSPVGSLLTAAPLSLASNMASGTGVIATGARRFRFRF